MPVHDWTKVEAGIFHHFHLRWIAEISDCLNDGRLPADYYALAEQYVGPLGPDVLALQRKAGPNGDPPGPALEPAPAGTIAVAARPPRAGYTAATEMGFYRAKQRAVVIRHVTGDRVVALVEIVSPGDKSSQHAMKDFVDKAAEALKHGYHLLILDLHPPTPRDPEGIHGAIWAAIEDDSYRQPPDKPLTLAANCAQEIIRTACIEPVAVGDVLPDMPLFLQADRYIEVPLEATYQAAFRNVPGRWRQVLEASPA